MTLVSRVSNAHHGRDFLLTQTAHLPAQGQVYGIARQDYVDDGEEQEWEFEPALMGSVTDWLMVEAHGHIEKIKGESTEYESTAAVGYVRFTPRDSALALGGAVEYEIASHDDDQDVWEFAGLASYESNAWMLAFNVTAEREAANGADVEWGYAAGARRGLSARLAAGLEVRGSFEGDQEGEVLLGVFTDPIPWLTVNVGVGTGFNGGADLSFRSALVFRFR